MKPLFENFIFWRYEFGGPELQVWIDLNREGTEIIGNGLAADYIPIMKHIPTPGMKRVLEVFNVFLGGIEKEIEEHRATYDVSSMLYILYNMF